MTNGSLVGSGWISAGNRHSRSHIVTTKVFLNSTIRHIGVPSQVATSRDNDDNCQIAQNRKETLLVKLERECNLGASQSLPEVWLRHRHSTSLVNLYISVIEIIVAGLSLSCLSVGRTSKSGDRLFSRYRINSGRSKDINSRRRQFMLALVRLLISIGRSHHYASQTISLTPTSILLVNHGLHFSQRISLSLGLRLATSLFAHLGCTLNNSLSISLAQFAGGMHINLGRNTMLDWLGSWLLSLVLWNSWHETSLIIDNRANSLAAATSHHHLRLGLSQVGERRSGIATLTVLNLSWFDNRLNNFASHWMLNNYILGNNILSWGRLLAIRRRPNRLVYFWYYQASSISQWPPVISVYHFCLLLMFLSIYCLVCLSPDYTVYFNA